MTLQAQLFTFLLHPGFWTVFVLVVAGAAAYVKINLRVCKPNEILIFSGRSQTRKDGRTVGYRIIRGGRALKIPIIESVSRLSLRTLSLEIDIDGVLAQGMIPISLRAVANVKIAGNEEEGLDHAIERFLGAPEGEIVEVAREIIEGNLRGVLATLSPEQANDDRLQVANRVIDESRKQLRRLGLVIDTLNIENLSDDRGYLEAIARQKNAEVTRDAETAEASARAEAEQVAAEARERAETAQHAADEAIVEAEHAYRMRKAELEFTSNQKEARARLAGEITATKEARKRDEAKIAQVEKQQEAEVLVPARAEKEAQELRAEGSAARIREDGRARATAMAAMREQWDDGNTRDLFLIQILPDIVSELSDTVSDNLNIDRISIVGGANGDGLPSHVRGVTGSVVSMMEELKNATGIDIAELLDSDAPAEELIRKELD